jgi:thiosulfate dehydrogenase [quinone] large subunit
METIKTVFTQARYTGLFWLVLRLFVGYEFFVAGWDKVMSGKWVGQNAIGGFMKGALTKAATGDHPEVQGWYVGLINNVFLPNAALFSTLVALGEVLVGLALIFGIFTKFAAVNGALMNIAFLAAGTSSSNPQMLVMQVAMVFGGLGVAYYGVDRFLMPFLARSLRIGQAARQTTALQTPRPVR